METSVKAVSVLDRHAAILAAASGTVHLAVIDDHAGSLLLMAAFAVMGLAQWAAAVGLWRHCAWAESGAQSVHATIILLWVGSRTVGIPLVTGWGVPEPVGVPDVVATAFGAAVVILVVARRRFRSPMVTFEDGPGALHWLTVAFVLMLVIPAVLAPHAHLPLEHDQRTPQDEQPGHGADDHHGSAANSDTADD